MLRTVGVEGVYRAMDGIRTRVQKGKIRDGHDGRAGKITSHEQQTIMIVEINLGFTLVISKFC